ncbi:unnamed protein product [Adineta steineri]|uniref:DUF1772-domain-containing protein n=1 Tax=Adineta steineri TaxID=433720 RepID=A0A814GWH5_9BILA|nr:unnamed protein product [Adineta steineri]CAF3730386.1 unnamed protein product [Adineta steineri]
MSTTIASIADHLDSLAVVGAGFFAGTALYITIGETPALQDFGLDEHWSFFPYMYKRAAVSQSIFSAVGGIAAIAHGTRINGSSFDRNLWIIAGTILIGMAPYTIFLMLPTNNTIINDNKETKLGKESQISVTQRKEILQKWAGLHLGRTITSVASFGAMVFGLSRHSSLLLGW